MVSAGLYILLREDFKPGHRSLVMSFLSGFYRSLLLREDFNTLSGSHLTEARAAKWTKYIRPKIFAREG